MWSDADAGVAFGHRRLSIIDRSAAGRQPMVSADGRYVIAYNGEIYNHRVLRRELSRRGRSFRGASDTEVLVEAISAWGLDDALTACNGMFAIAVWDVETRLLTLAVDRIGEKPLYYGWQRGTFLFGSEIRALRRHPAFLGTIDRNALTLFMRHGYVPAPFTIFEDIRKLEPGTLVQIAADDGSQATPRPYWSALHAVTEGLRQPLSGSADDHLEQLDLLLRDSVGLRMLADVPVGAFLSGGIDSSLVVALMQAQARHPVRTFTIGFPSAAYDEADHARAVAEHLGTDHTELVLDTRDALAVIPSMPRVYDEPFADPSQVPTFLVARMAREDVTVCLSGDGGDELFGGYEHYQVQRALDPWQRWVPFALRRSIAGAVRRLPVATWDRAGAVVEPMLPGALRHKYSGRRIHKAAELLGLADFDDVRTLLASQWTRPTDVVRGGRETSTAPSDASGTLGGLHPVDRLMYLDTVDYLPGDILTKVDRATMAVGLEGRMPLLDHRVLDFAWSLPRDEKLRASGGKWLLRRLLDRYVPPALTARPKAGFDVPLADWLRGPLRDWSEWQLDGCRLDAEGLLDAGVVRRRWSAFIDGDDDARHELWCVLMFQAWYDQQSADVEEGGCLHAATDDH